MTHIDAIDQLKYGVGLLSYGQKNPVVEYKFQAFQMFEDMNNTIRDQAVRMVLTLKLRANTTLERKRVAGPGKEARGGSAPNEEGQAQDKQSAPQKSVVRQTAKVGRNDPCPCGSGKKYKNCCGE
jgi:preprotein translocase subunit SecA